MPDTLKVVKNHVETFNEEDNGDTPEDGTPDPV